MSKDKELTKVLKQIHELEAEGRNFHSVLVDVAILHYHKKLWEQADALIVAISRARKNK